MPHDLRGSRREGPGIAAAKACSDRWREAGIEVITRIRNKTGDDWADGEANNESSRTPTGTWNVKVEIVQFPDPNPDATAPAADIVTEDFAAYKFAELHAGRLRYCHAAGAWFEWNGAAWRQIRISASFPVGP